MLQGDIFDVCNGECGATEEHIIKYDERHTDQCHVDKRTSIIRDGHYPLIAGYTPDGEPLYIAIAFLDYIPYAYVGLPDDYNLDQLRVKTHYSDGSEQIFPYSFRILVLLYDPEVYSLNK